MNEIKYALTQVKPISEIQKLPLDLALQEIKRTCEMGLAIVEPAKIIPTSISESNKTVLVARNHVRLKHFAPAQIWEIADRALLSFANRVGSVDKYQALTQYEKKELVDDVVSYLNQYKRYTFEEINLCIRLGCEGKFGNHYSKVTAANIKMFLEGYEEYIFDAITEQNKYIEEQKRLAYEEYKKTPGYAYDSFVESLTFAIKDYSENKVFIPLQHFYAFLCHDLKLFTHELELQKTYKAQAFEQIRREELDKAKQELITMKTVSLYIEKIKSKEGNYIVRDRAKHNILADSIIKEWVDKKVDLATIFTPELKEKYIKLKTTSN